MNNEVIPTLKGIALVMAAESGLIPEREDGYNIAPFLRFWELFEPELHKALNPGKNFSKVFHQQSESGTDQEQH